MTRRCAVVVGGGLAGITAALELADAGVSVTLLEARPRLGGLTASFRRGELEVDTGQHVFMRCCTSYRRLLDRLGETEHTVLQRRMDVPVLRPRDGRRGRLHRDPLPVVAGLPLHLTRALLTYAVLTPTERVSAARASLALRAVDAADPATDEVSFGEWLGAHHQSPAAVAALWDLVGVATLNARADQASLALAATVFQLGLLTDPGAADLGWATIPLQRLHGDAAARALASVGAVVSTRCRVDRVERGEDGWSVHTSAGEQRADAVVVATEPVAAERLLPSAALELPPGWSQRLGASPIVNVHAVFDRQVMSEAFLACAGSPLQWLFDRTRASGLATGQYVAASLSAAEAESERPVAQLRDELLPELHRALPAARNAQLLDFFVTREPHATFRQRPGSGRWRPPARTRHAGLVLAGAHTATGWPATMEGAVRSGETAAAVVCEQLSARAGSAGRTDEGVAA